MEVELEYRMTAREKLIFDHLRSNKKATIDDLQELLKGKRGVKPPKNGLNVSMKYMAAKLAPYGWIIQNEGGIGSGKKAVYSMKKKF